MFQVLLLLFAFGLLVAIFTTSGLVWLTQSGSVKVMSAKTYGRQIAALQTISTLTSIVLAWLHLETGHPAQSALGVIVIVQFAVTFTLGFIRNHSLFLNAWNTSRGRDHREALKQRRAVQNYYAPLSRNPDSPEAREIQDRAWKIQQKQLEDRRRTLKVFEDHDAKKGVVYVDYLARAADDHSPLQENDKNT